MSDSVMDAPAEAEMWTDAALPDNGTGSNGTGVGHATGGRSLLSFAIAQPFLWFFMFFSNLAVLIVYRRYLGFKTLTNYFVYNIAVADLCMSFNMLVQMIFFIRPHLSASEHLCMFRMELMAFFTTVSLLSGLFATIDRFMMIVINRHYNVVMSVRNVKLMIGFAWVYSFLFAALPFFANNWETTRRCVFVTLVPGWYIIFGSSQTIVTTLVEIALYVAIFHVATRRRRRFKTAIFRTGGGSTLGPGTAGSSGAGVSGGAGALPRAPPKEQQSLRGAKFMAVVLITYSLCWWPFAILGYIQIIMYHPSLTIVRMIMVFLGISNSLLNPLVYAWQKKDFRDGLKRLLGLNHRQARVQPERSTRRTSLA